MAMKTNITGIRTSSALTYVTPSTLNRAIVLARKAFADDSGGSSYIQTVHGAGYRYVGPFKLLTVPSREPRARQRGESG
jgi:DNA-binding winged helix-turn-helix (wHTH) protein